MMPMLAAADFHSLWKQTVRWCFTVGIWGLCWLTIGWDVLQAEEPERLSVLETTDQLRWYRGNLHTHSHWSDGDDYLEMIAHWYQEQGYQFLCFTDHNRLADEEYWVAVDKTRGGRTAYEKLIQQFPEWVETRGEGKDLEVRLRRFQEVAEKFNQPEKFLLIQGEEISDRFEKHPIHMNVSNVKELITPRSGGSVAEVIQNNVNAALAQRAKSGQTMMIHLNHPNYKYAITAEDLMLIIGERFFEVYNGHPTVFNHGDELHASTERIWDIVLTKRLAEFELPAMFGLATDDGHNYHDMPSRKSNPGRGWVMVLADDLQAETLIKAMERGDFYASSGVTLSRIEQTENQISVEIEPAEGAAYQIEFIGTRKGYDPEGQPYVDDNGEPLPVTQRYSEEIGEVLKTVRGTSATYEIQGDEIYVRARITSSEHHPNPSEIHDHKMAWTQPFVLLKPEK